MSRHVITGLMAMAGLAMATGAAQADAVADFYKGKNIEIVVGAGGGGYVYGLYNRVLAEHLGRHIQGQPTITLKFMSGSAGVKAAK